MTIRKMFWLGVIGAVSLVLVPYSIPLLLALVTALMLEPVVLFFTQTGRMKRVFSVTLTFLLFLAVFGLGGYWVTAKLIVQAIELTKRLPALSRSLFESVEKYIWMWQNYYASLPMETVTTIQKLLDALKNSAMSAASNLAEGVVGMAAGLPAMLLVTVVYLVGLFLISLDLPKLRTGFMNMFTNSAREKVDLVLTQLSRATVGFIRAQLILSLMTYVLALSGLLILHVKYAAIIAFLIVLVDILPILGTGSFLVPWAVYNFFTGNTRLAIGLLILFTVITVIRRIVEPKILGSSLGISALAALASMYLGFQLLGFIGLILGPAVVIIIEALRKAGFIKFKFDF
jgi:sporulation integral membrane protein YtvI